LSIEAGRGADTVCFSIVARSAIKPMASSRGGLIITCADFLSQLNDYLDGEIDAIPLAELNQHVVACRPCRVLLVTTRQTIEIFRESEIYNFPFAVRSRIRSAIMDKCSARRERHPQRNVWSMEATSRRHATITRLKAFVFQRENPPGNG